MDSNNLHIIAEFQSYFHQIFFFSTSANLIASYRGFGSSLLFGYFKLKTKAPAWYMVKLLVFSKKSWSGKDKIDKRQQTKYVYEYVKHWNINWMNIRGYFIPYLTKNWRSINPCAEIHSNWSAIIWMECIAAELFLWWKFTTTKAIKVHTGTKQIH